MRYNTSKEILCSETYKTFHEGMVVSLKFNDGGGCGGCKITKITDTGFHFNQGGGRDKSIQYKDIAEIHM